MRAAQQILAILRAGARDDGTGIPACIVVIDKENTVSRHVHGASGRQAHPTMYPPRTPGEVEGIEAPFTPNPFQPNPVHLWTTPPSRNCSRIRG